MTRPVDVEHYNRALDEIYRLRSLLGYEASCTRAQLDYATIPKGLRVMLERQADRLLKAAKGDSEQVVAEMTSDQHRSLRWIRDDIGMVTLTRDGWEAR